MAVVAIRQIPKSEQASATLSPDGTESLTEVQTWHILVGGGDDWQNFTPTVAMLASDPSGHVVPAVGSAHPLLPLLLRVKTRDCKRSEQAPNLFIATVTYGTVPNATADGPKDKWYINVNVTGVERTEDLHNDLQTRLPIVNSTNEGFDPPVKLIDYDEEIEVKFRTLTVDFSLYSALRGKISDDTVTMIIRGQSRVFPPKTLKLAKLEYSTEVGDGIQYYQVNLVLHYRTQLDENGLEVGHVRQVVDRGFYTFNESYGEGDPPSKQFIPIVDAHGNPRTTPAFLDGNGRELAPDGSGNLPQCALLPYHVDRVDSLSPLLNGIS
jgi:hypothetical protein